MGLRKLKEFSSRKYIILIILLLIGINLELNFNNDLQTRDFIKKEVIDSSSNPKIYIDGNQEWINFKNVGYCSGFGNYTHPYIIKDLKIDGGGLGSCITIRNSNVHFVIENCSLYNSGNLTVGGSGIKLFNTSNGILINNNCSSNGDGIKLLFQCYNNTISGNLCGNNNRGICLWSNCSNNIILRNKLSKNNFLGIYSFEFCNNNSFLENIIEESKNGLSLHFDCYNNTIFRNNVSISSYGIRLKDHCGYNLISENLIVENLYGLSLDFDNNDNIILKNNISRNYIYGIYIGFIAENIIYLGTEVNLDVGPIIVLNGSYNNIFFKNLIFNNQWFGAYIDSDGSDDNYFYNNSFIRNNINAEDNGFNHWNNSFIGNYWDDYEGIDANDDGIGDIPYNISGSTGSKDFYPIWDDGIEGSFDMNIIKYIFFFILIMGKMVIIGIIYVIINHQRKRKLEDND